MSTLLDDNDLATRKSFTSHPYIITEVDRGPPKKEVMQRLVREGVTKRANIKAGYKQLRETVKGEGDAATAKKENQINR